LADWTDRHVQGAAAQLYPSATRLPQPREPIEFADPAAAGRWLKAERDNLTALVMTACDIGRPELAWRIPFACRDYLFLQAGQAMMIKMGQAGLAALAQRPDPGAQAAVELVMAQAHNLVGQDDRALRHAARCLAKAREAGWRRMEIDAYNAMSVYHLHVGDLPASAHTARMAVDLSGDLGAPTTQHRGKLGLINLLLGQLHQARGHLEQTLQSQSGQANHSRGITLLNLADVCRLLGDTACAGERIAEAIDLFEKIGSVHLAGVARCTLVHLHLAEGRTGQAKMVADAARANLEGFNGAIAQAQLCHAYGLALAACGLATEGLTVLRDGLAAAAAMRNPHPAIQLMIAFGEVERIVDNQHAVEVLTEAAARARAGHFAVLEAQALDLLAAAHLDRGRRAPARRAARRALDLAQRTGYAGTRHAAAVLEPDNH
jgi:tetratricopeptide (TPR) repeat protein